VADYALRPNQLWLFLTDVQQSNLRCKQAKLGIDWNTEFLVGSLCWGGTWKTERGLASLSQIFLFWWITGTKAWKHEACCQTFFEM